MAIILLDSTPCPAKGLMGLWSQLYHLITIWDYESHLTFLHLSPHSPLPHHWDNNADHVALLWRSTITMCLAMLWNEPALSPPLDALGECKYTSPVVTIPIKNKWQLNERTGRVCDKGSLFASPPSASLTKSRWPGCVPICIAEPQS